MSIGCTQSQASDPVAGMTPLLQHDRSETAESLNILSKQNHKNQSAPMRDKQQTLRILYTWSTMLEKDDADAETDAKKQPQKPTAASRKQQLPI